jgi:hypothetical protein
MTRRSRCNAEITDNCSSAPLHSADSAHPADSGQVHRPTERDIIGLGKYADFNLTADRATVDESNRPVGRSGRPEGRKTLSK